jgi:hypothetical protein
MVAAYTGNGAYCFSNSLHMSLLAAGADPFDLARDVVPRVLDGDAVSAIGPWSETT